MFNDKFYINGFDCWVKWGVTFERGTFAELLKPAKRKPTLEHDWMDENGTERDVSVSYMESREMELPVILTASTRSAFLSNLSAFVETIQASGYVELNIIDLNRSFSLVYDSASNVDFSKYLTQYTSVARFGLKFIDDFPGQILPVDPNLIRTI